MRFTLKSAQKPNMQRRREKKTNIKWLLVWFYIINLTAALFQPSQTKQVFYCALAILSRVSWCRHPANSFINDLRVWYSPRKRNEKTCICPSAFHWHGVNIEQTGPHSAASERVKSVWCRAPLSYLRATAVEAQVPLWHPFHWLGTAIFTIPFQHTVVNTDELLQCFCKSTTYATLEIIWM